MEYISVKSILSHVKPTENYLLREYNMNLYRGCSHGCIYCDSRSSCYQIDRFNVVRAKENALAILEEELRRKRKTGVIGTGSMCDPYNPFEENEKITRGALELIDRYGFGISIVTKSPLIMRDAGLYKSIAQHSPVDIHMTITTTDDALSRVIEPHVAPSSERFAALKDLSAQGLFTGVFMMPILPFITDGEENIQSLVEKAADCGVRNIVFAPGMTLRNGNREHYFAALDVHFPQLRRRYERAFGNRYSCYSPQARTLWRTFTQACDKWGILYNPKAINQAVRRQSSGEQLAFL